MAATATVTLRLTEVDEVVEFVEKMTAFMAYTADLEDLFALVKNDPSISSAATAEACITSLKAKHGVTTLPYLAMEEAS